jgi:hypothetical protein
MPNLEVFGPIMKEEYGNTQNAPNFGKVKLIYRFQQIFKVLKKGVCHGQILMNRPVHGNREL